MLFQKVHAEEVGAAYLSIKESGNNVQQVGVGVTRCRSFVEIFFHFQDLKNWQSLDQ